MIKNWLITGDNHRDFNRFANLHYKYEPQETAIVVLGDFCLNYCMNTKDRQFKKRINKLGYVFYVVRGNHEERPELMPSVKIVYDEEILNNIYIEDDYPNIKYLIDGEIYSINYQQTLVIGGAYSIDKQHRLLCKAPWFPQEQLSTEEMKIITNKVKGKSFDLILSHTCPYSFQPFDTFLSWVDQNQVDNSMELWMEELTKLITWNLWCFGHHHVDRYDIYKKFRAFYKDIESLEVL